jgi:hypothetical protein
MFGSLLSRRRLIELTATGYLGLNLGGLWQAQASTSKLLASTKQIRSCILVFFYGGPSHIDTFDLKPEAPAEVRGEFKPIATSAPGIRICEHLPYLAKWMHKIALVRSVTHQARLHDSASIHALTGRPLEGPDRELFAPLPQVYPSYGSAVSYFQRHRKQEVPFASLPFTFRNVLEVPCQGGGMLGSAYDPLLIETNPAEKRYQVDVLRRSEEMNSNRLKDRRQLLEKLEPTSSRTKGLFDKAYQLLESDSIRIALDINREPIKVRERYGFGSDPLAVGEGGGGGNGSEMGYARQMRGQNFLLARRLVEAGVPFVNIYDFKQQGQNWDAHFKGANQHKTYLLPQADRGLSALIEDLEARGLLDSTLVVAMGEFGRTPKINKEAGRDHWPDCYTILFAGGGIQGGSIYGSSDRMGAYPASDPVTPGDIAATIFWRFGIDPSTEIHDQLGRPHRLASGDPITRIFST